MLDLYMHPFNFVDALKLIMDADYHDYCADDGEAYSDDCPFINQVVVYLNNDLIIGFNPQSTEFLKTKISNDSKFKKAVIADGIFYHEKTKTMCFCFRSIITEEIHRFGLVEIVHAIETRGFNIKLYLATGLRYDEISSFPNWKVLKDHPIKKLRISYDRIEIQLQLR